MWHCHSSVALQLSSADCNSARFHEDRHCAMCGFFCTTSHFAHISPFPAPKRNCSKELFPLDSNSLSPSSIDPEFVLMRTRSLAAEFGAFIFSRFLLLAVRSFAFFLEIGCSLTAAGYSSKVLPAKRDIATNRTFYERFCQIRVS